MNTEKINEIIRRKNDQLEESAVRTAEELVNNIVELQASITSATEEIVKNREELKKLQITSINPTSILGA